MLRTNNEKSTCNNCNNIIQIYIPEVAHEPDYFIDLLGDDMAIYCSEKCYKVGK